MHIYELINNNTPTFIEIRKETIVFSEPIRTQSVGISTEDPDEMKRALSFLNQYPINRQTNWLGLNSNTGNAATISIRFIVNVGYKDPRQEPNTLTYQLSDNGHMVFSFLYPGFLQSGENAACGIGRFGQAQTKEFYQKLDAYLKETQDHPQWHKKEIS